MVDGDCVADRWKWVLPQENERGTVVAQPERSHGWTPRVLDSRSSVPLAFDPPPSQDDGVEAREDLRQSDRYPVARDISLRHGQREWTGSMTNLSLGGARLRLSEPNALVVGDRIEVSFAIPTAPERLRAVAEVRWRVEKGSPSVGIQFVTGFRARETWALGRYLEQIRRTR